MSNVSHVHPHGFFLDMIMVLSHCCKSTVWVYSSDEGTSFYICYKCDMACDTLSESSSGESRNDTRITSEIEAIVGNS